MHGGQEDLYDYEPYRQILLATWPKSVGSDVDADCISSLTSHQIAFANVKVQYIPTFCISLFCAVPPGLVVSLDTCNCVHCWHPVYSIMDVSLTCCCSHTRHPLPASSVGYMALWQR